jgi:hypothetical protein
MCRRGGVRRQVRQMARLIDDLLDVGRITTDRFMFARRPLKLPRLSRLPKPAGLSSMNADTIFR